MLAGFLHTCACVSWRASSCSASSALYNLLSASSVSVVPALCRRSLRACSNDAVLSPAAFDKISDETLESLSTFFDDMLEQHLTEQQATDVHLSSGVLTVRLGATGTYVINKQTPNRQIWLSSPVSGPKRYDFRRSSGGGGWYYRHDGASLHALLSRELSQLTGSRLDLSHCSFAQ